MSFFGNQRVDVFKKQYKAFTGVYCDKPQLDKGGKIILPSSALHTLSNMSIVWPIMFRISNPSTGTFTHCGVLEFSANEGQAFIPFWLMQYLRLKPGESVQIQTATLRKGTYVKIRPQKQAFIKLSNPKAILEKQLRDFACLTKGDTIIIKYNSVDYCIDVLEVRDQNGPCQAISIVETDISLDFERPADMPESPKQTKPKMKRDDSLLFDDSPVTPSYTRNIHSKKKDKKGKEEPEKAPSFNPFAGTGARIDGKTPKTPTSQQSNQAPIRASKPKKLSTPTSTKKDGDYWANLGKGRSLK